MVPEAALAEARGMADRGDDAGAWLVRAGHVASERLLHALARYYRRPPVTLSWFHPEAEALALVPQDVARRFHLLPLFVLDERLYAACVDPDDLAAQDFIQQLCGYTVEPVLALPDDLDTAFNRAYLSAEQAGRVIGALAQSATGVFQIEEVEHVEDRDAPAIRLAEHILSNAIRMGASDIHLEPYSKRIELRYRVDGILHEYPAPPTSLYPALVSRIKIASRLDIAEKRLPQDGRMTTKVDERDYDMRVAIIPNLHGEGIVIRILNSAALNRRLADMELPSDVLERWRRCISRPHGMVLVTGPTGSGKTTTLYASLSEIYTTQRKFVTLEDPVELQMDGITQIPMRADIGLTFAEGLRSVLRYDPDVILVGEIRDAESADIAVRAAMTGHMLLSTLHTNDAALTVTRLVDMGIDAFKVMSSLTAVLAQRLVRRLCPACKQPAAAETVAAALGNAGIAAGVPLSTVYRAVGCPDCGGLGYRGRIGIYELLEITPAMRRLSAAELHPERLRELAVPGGFRTLRDSAIDRLRAGITSLDEVVAMTGDE
jgi:type II secretory ATPase GspE/PulE/Tfp pilus assembly ATPase PilB-like protein